MLFPFGAIARNEVSADSAKVYFKLGQRQYYSGYRDNGSSMDRFINAVGKAVADSSISRIIVRGYASPDGSYKANKRLSELRCRTVYDYLVRNSSVDSLLIDMQPEGIAWQELRAMIAADSGVPYRDEVLQVLDETPLWVFDSAGRVTGSRKKALMDLRGGVPYRWIYNQIFPTLRNAVAVMLYVKQQPDTPAVVETLIPAEPNVAVIDTVAVATESTVPVEEAVIPADTIIETVEVIEAETPHEPLHRFALKTNLVYDALLMPSVELEWRINDRWSVAMEYDIAWWKNDRKHKYYQVMVFTPEVKWWFNTRKPWHGMYVGAFTGGGKYDLENGHRGYKGEGGFAGLSFGYMWPISRNLSLEAAVGAGYMYTRYKEYIPFEGHYVYQRTSQTNYFGPLKAKFAFVWRFNDINRRKR